MNEDRLKVINEIVKKIDSMESNPWKDSERGRLKESIFDNGHVDWLIKQIIIERTKYEVMIRIKDHQVRQKDLAHEKNEELEQQNKRYREALEFYAEGNHYYAEGYPNTTLKAVDYGEVAREALEGDSDE